VPYGAETTRVAAATATAGGDEDGDEDLSAAALMRRDSSDSVREASGNSNVTFARFKPSSARVAERHDSVDLKLEAALSSVATSLRSGSSAPA